MSLWSDLVTRLRHGASASERQARIDRAQEHEATMARADALVASAQDTLDRSFAMAQEYRRTERRRRR